MSWVFGASPRASGRQPLGCLMAHDSSLAWQPRPASAMLHRKARSLTVLAGADQTTPHPHCLSRASSHECIIPPGGEGPSPPAHPQRRPCRPSPAPCTAAAGPSRRAPPGRPRPRPPPTCAAPRRRGRCPRMSLSRLMALAGTCIESGPLPRLPVGQPADDRHSNPVELQRQAGLCYGQSTSAATKALLCATS
jgi:hypothetical protein